MERVYNEEIGRFVKHVGGVNETAKVFDCTPDMVQKLRRGDREFKAKYVRIMHGHKGFRLSFKRLFGLEQ